MLVECTGVFLYMKLDLGPEFITGFPSPLMRYLQPLHMFLDFESNDSFQGKIIQKIYLLHATFLVGFILLPKTMTTFIS